MIGVFLVNRQNNIAFVQHGEHKDIAQFIYFEHNQMCMAELRTGGEELFDNILPPEVQGAFERNRRMLVAHINQNGEYIAEYQVPLVVQA